MRKPWLYAAKPANPGTLGIGSEWVPLPTKSSGAGLNPTSSSPPKTAVPGSATAETTTRDCSVEGNS